MRGTTSWIQRDSSRFKPSLTNRISPTSAHSLEVKMEKPPGPRQSLDRGGFLSLHQEGYRSFQPSSSHAIGAA